MKLYKKITQEYYHFSGFHSKNVSNIFKVLQHLYQHDINILRLQN